MEALRLPFDGSRPTATGVAPFSPGDDGLRPYQIDALNGALRTLETERGAVIVMATGTGKTRTAAALIRRWPGRCLWLTHLDTLVQQSQADLEEALGVYVDLEQASFRAAGGRVVIASVQTLSRPTRLKRFPPDTFNLIIVDEAHHVTAETYRRIVGHFSAAKVVGVTATPNRMDKAALDDVIGPRAFTYGITHGVADGYLVPIRTAVAELSKLDLSKLKARGGDFSDSELAREMDRPEIFRAIVEGTIANAGDRRTVLFFPSVETAHIAAQTFMLFGRGARAVDGGTHTDVDAKKHILREHQRGAFQFLCNVGVTAEGYNDKGIGCVAIVRPTRSKSMHAQWVGRWTRPLADVDGGAPDLSERRARIAASSKPDLLVIDFTANSGKHDLASVTDYIAGNVDADVAKAAKEIAKKKPGVLASEAVAMAKEEVTEVKRRIAEEAARVAKATAVTLRWRSVDAFKVLGMKAPAPKPGEARATVPQRTYLEKKGYECPPGMTFSQAQALIRADRGRRAAGLASFKQVKTLRKANVQAPERMRFATANALIAHLSANGWRFRPGDVDRIVASTRAGAEG